MKKTSNYDFHETAFLAALLLGIVLSFTGCGTARIAPGKTQTAISPAGEVTAAAVQSQDPQAATTQTIETDTVTSQSATTIEPSQSDPAPVTRPGAVTTAASQPIVIESHKKITTTIGASQKDLTQEISAKLASIRWLQWLGVVIAFFGIASMTYPPLRLIVGSVTTSAWCIGAGAAMVFLPLVIVGHEILIVGVACGVAGIWFLAHRHGSLAGELATVKSFLAGASTPAPAPVTASPATTVSQPIPSKPSPSTNQA